MTTPPLHPPAAPTVPHLVEGPHGPRDDVYHWMSNEDRTPLLAHLHAENEHTKRAMSPLEADMRALYEELVGRIQEEDRSIATRDGCFEYYARTERGAQYAIQCRRRVDVVDAPEEVLLDPNRWTDALSFVGIGDFEVSPDGRWLAYTLDRTGFRQYALRLKDLTTGQTLDVEVPRVTSVAWAADSATMLLTQEDAQTKRSCHLLSMRRTDAAPTLVATEPDERFSMAVETSKDRAFFFVHVASHTTSEVWRIPTQHPTRAPETLLPRSPGVEYDVEHRCGQMLLRINDAGSNFRLVETDLEIGAPSSWRTLVPHRDEVMLSGVEVFRSHVVLHERRHGLSALTVLTDDGTRRSIDFPDEAYEIYGGWNPDFEATALRFRYESPARPMTDYTYDFATGGREQLKQRQVLGDFDPARYRVRRLHCVARDGVSVPVTLVSRADATGQFNEDGTPTRPRPLLLIGYGAYGYPYPTGFSSAQLSLLDRGVDVAIAHVRGGGELGKRWHDAGRMQHKQRTFSDFIDCAEDLIARGFTAPDRLAIEGGSAGGLLVGAVVNARPDLWAAVLSHVPFVDVLNTMSDPSLPLTVGEYEEWGDPRDPDAYATMHSYCPYTNLRAQSYPTMLVKTSLHDSQVMVWEPAKYVARLRTVQTNDAPVLLHINMEGGHGGASGRYDRLKETAFDYAFLLSALDIPVREDAS